MRRALLILFVLAFTGAGACNVSVSDNLRDALDQLRDTDTAGGADAGGDAGGTPTGDVVGPTGDTAACPERAPCDDGDPCTVGDFCAGGRCVGPFSVNCDDGDPCTDDDCAPDRGCMHAQRDDPTCRAPLPCPDGCEDDNPCTVDSCDETVGDCVHRPLASCRPCDPDGDWARTCDDGDAGTVDGCAQDAALGGTVCTHTPQPCGLDPSTCDDGDPCTLDSLGLDCLCTHEPTSGPCDDGDPCTVDDECVDGICQGDPSGCQ